jgi:hypothetical protein
VPLQRFESVEWLVTVTDAAPTVMKSLSPAEYYQLRM